MSDNICTPKCLYHRGMYVEAPQECTARQWRRAVHTLVAHMCGVLCAAGYHWDMLCAWHASILLVTCDVVYCRCIYQRWLICCP